MTTYQWKVWRVEAQDACIMRGVVEAASLRYAFEEAVQLAHNCVATEPEVVFGSRPGRGREQALLPAKLLLEVEAARSRGKEICRTITIYPTTGWCPASPDGRHRWVLGDYPTEHCECGLVKEHLKDGGYALYYRQQEVAQ
jgi:hypothetical protein